ncbi:MAG: hypothetical protein ACFFAN_12455 [Promethearchaeota archaeon]
MNRTKLNFKEQILLTLYFSQENQSNITRLMKLLFLYDEIFNINLKKDLNFIEHNFGPWAENFETLMTPFILANVISLRTRNEKKRFSYSNEKEERIKNLIKSKYLTKSEYKSQINLIRFLSTNYDIQKLDELIQLVYFLKPEFTDKSQIKNQIERKSTEINQDLMISFFEDISIEYVTKLLRNIDGILKIFNIQDKKNLDFLFFKNLFQKFNDYYDKPNKFQKQDLLSFLYNYNSKTKYKQLKLGLISIFSMFDIEWNENFYRNLYLLIFKSIKLKWPLNQQNYERFNDLIVKFKDNTKLISFFRDIPNLTEKERIFTLELPNNMKNIEIKKEISSSSPLYKKKKTQKRKLIFTDYEDYNEEEDKEENRAFEETYSIIPE